VPLTSISIVFNMRAQPFARLNAKMPTCTIRRRPPPGRLHRPTREREFPPPACTPRARIDTVPSFLRRPPLGAACLVELRALQRAAGEPLAPFLRDGDEVTVDVIDRQGRSLFGRLDTAIRGIPAATSVEEACA
jgi:hypothetical protein